MLLLLTWKLFLSFYVLAFLDHFYFQICHFPQFHLVYFGGFCVCSIVRGLFFPLATGGGITTSFTFGVYINTSSLTFNLLRFLKYAILEFPE